MAVKPSCAAAFVSEANSRVDEDNFYYTGCHWLFFPDDHWIGRLLVHLYHSITLLPWPEDTCLIGANRMVSCASNCSYAQVCSGINLGRSCDRYLTRVCSQL